jgi:hypothetical protein
LRLGHGTLELGSHPVAGLDRDHVRARRNKRTCELARARTEIEHRTTCSELESLGKPCNRFDRIFRARSLVHVGDELERARIRVL